MISNILILTISITLLVLVGIIYQKSRKFKTDIKYLMATLVSIAIANTAVGLNIDNLILMMIMTSFLPLGILFLFFHYEEISHPRPRLSLLIIILGLYIFLVSSKLIIPIYMSLNGFSLNIYYTELRLIGDIFIFTLFRFANFLSSVIIFSVFLLAFITVMKELKVIKIRAILIESVGLMCLIIYGLLYLIRDIFFYETAYEILTSIALIFSLIGLLLIISNFILHPDYLYLIPFPIFNFMIFNEGGTSCYFRKVKALDEIQPKKNIEHLMAGALSAVSTMFKEVLGAGASIEYIDAGDFKILVTSLAEKKGIFVVISGGETALFKKSIIRFTRTWPYELLKEINEMFDLNELRPKIDKLVKISFPYVAF
ncbi:MAG: membrane protein of unknown function [Promethearchaeota archaeon]|nr:MAG: membrane protein of unknown function [Candidatus Lokiarchaeota archaeon]